MLDSELASSSPRGDFDAHWYAIQTRSRHEKTVSEQLRTRRFQTFLPLYVVEREWKNGAHRVQLPLFPGYTFVRIAPRERLDVLRVYGVVRLVGFDVKPIAIDDTEIQALQRTVSMGTKTRPHPYLTVGQRIRITGGAFSGYEGFFLRRKNTNCLVLSIGLIQRSVIIEIGECDVEQISDSAPDRKSTPPSKSNSVSLRQYARIEEPLDE